ncbi:MAG: carbohydrate kinase [Bacillota bacterium]
MDVLCLGEMVIDFLPGDQPGVYIRKAGGAPANVAIAVSRQGVQASFLGMMGNDDFGRFLLATLRENGVTPLLNTLTDEAVTTMAFVTLTETGERSFTFARKPGADMLLTPAHVRDADILAATVVHAGSCSLSKGKAADATVHALRRARALGRMTSFDVNFRPLLWGGDATSAARAVMALLPVIDLLKVSEEELLLFGGRDGLLTAARENGIAVVALTMGGEGALCWYQGQEIRIPPVSAVCVDATGAGDAFWGAFLASLIRAGVTQTAHITRANLREALRMGAVSGSLCVRRKGAIESLPTLAQVRRYEKEGAE